MAAGGPHDPDGGGPCGIDIRGQASDLQGGLATAVALLQADHATLDPKELPYARYVVVVVSDSVPEPTCTVGCEDDAAACSDGTDNDADGLIDGADPSCATLELYGVCNQAGKVPPGYYVDMSGDCPSYNQPGQLSIHVNHLLALETSPGVGGVTVHTRLVSDPIPVVEKVCALQGHEQIHLQVSALLSDLAKLGGGSFSVAEPGDPFLDGIDYGAIAMP